MSEIAQRSRGISLLESADERVVKYGLFERELARLFFLTQPLQLRGGFLIERVFASQVYYKA